MKTVKQNSKPLMIRKIFEDETLKYISKEFAWSMESRLTKSNNLHIDNDGGYSELLTRLDSSMHDELEYTEINYYCITMSSATRQAINSIVDIIIYHQNEFIIRIPVKAHIDNNVLCMRMGFEKKITKIKEHK